MTKMMSLDEFRDLGLLQEINRRLLHPMGLALCLTSYNAESGDYLEVIDARDDPEGMVFTEMDRDKVESVNTLFTAKIDARVEALGFHVQPSYDVQPEED